MREKQGVLLREWSRWLTIVVGVAVATLLVLAAKPAQGAGTAERAKSADSFVNSIGVNTHLNYFDTAYGDYPVIRDKLYELGIRNIRDGAHLTSDPNYNNIVYGRYKELASRGIKANLMVDPRSSNLRTIDAEKIRQIADLAGDSLQSFEGPNEYDISGKGDWANELRAYQRDLYRAIKDNGSTEDVPVLGPSLTSSEAYTALGDLSNHMDYGNTHNYFGGRHPGTSGWGPDGYGSIGYNVRNAQKNSGSKPAMSTETGYHNVVPSPNGHLGTPESAAGKYMPRIYLEHFNRGIPRTYAYEFIDQWPDPGKTDPEKNFGLLRNDGSEKPSYKALKNLIGLLEDPGASFSPGSLDYSLSGDTQDVHRTLLQKRDGKFYLVLWVEKPSWDPGTRQRISVPEQRVTLNLNQPIKKASTYRPNDSASPTDQRSTPTQLNLDVPDHPLVIELETGESSGGGGGGTGGGGPTTCDAGEYQAEYYNNLTLDDAPTLERCETSIDNDWGVSGSPGSEISSNFSARWTGTHNFEAGEYNFSTIADDGVKMWVDGELVVDGWQDQAATTYEATREMSAGEHEVKVEYYDSGNAAVAKVDWEKTGGAGGNAAPKIRSIDPEPKSKTRSSTPRIKATVSDDQTDLAKSDITLSIDGNAVTDFDYDPATDQLSYTSERLSRGKHRVRIVASDEQGLSKSRHWRFEVVRS